MAALVRLKQLKGPRCVGFVHCDRCPLSPQEDASFCPFIARRSAPGSVLFGPGDPAKYVWFVKEGVVGLADSPEGAVKQVQDAGGWVGMDCAEDGTYGHSAVVLVAATLCGAPRSEVKRMLDESEEKDAAQPLSSSLGRQSAARNETP